MSSLSRRGLGLLFSLLAPTILLGQGAEPVRFARNAGIANDGRVAFTYQDDI